MKIDSKNIKLSVKAVMILPMTILLTGLLLPQIALAFTGEEVSVGLRRGNGYYKSGYYEEYEMMPRHQRPRVTIPGVSRDVFSYSQTASAVRIRTHLADSHIGIRFYIHRQCWDCHQEEALNHHSINAGITCRQCHGGEPIAGINHYYSPLNPIRRHAYLCAKCHEGAGASFATYLIHEPPAGAQETKMTFPQLYYASWFMIALLIGTLGFFIPHTFLLGLRELFSKIKKHKL